MVTCGDLALWIIGIYFAYKLVDWLIRLPFISRTDLVYVMVTGCDTGFGHEIAKRLTKRGSYVIAACLTEKGEKEIKQVTGHRLTTVRLDVSDPESVRKAYAEVKEYIPEGKGLWALLNNAGISGKAGPSEWLQLKDYQQVFNVNLLGLIDTTITFLPLIKQAKGRVINTASIFGRFALPGGAPYTISKYGVEAFSDGLRRQMKPFGVTVSLIEPGIHKTNITSTENITKAMVTSFDEAPKSLQEEYGRQFVDDALQAVMKQFVSGIISENIQDVVDGCEHAILGLFPRARYVIGRDAKFLFLPIQWMPEWLGDWILIHANQNRPIPAALKKKL